MRAGAIGAVSALASAFPAEVGAVVHEPTEAAGAQLGDLRATVDTFPRQAALKRIIAAKGVPIASAVRAPLRDLTLDEAVRLDAWLVAR